MGKVKQYYTMTAQDYVASIKVEADGAVVYMADMIKTIINYDADKNLRFSTETKDMLRERLDKIDELSRTAKAIVGLK